MVLLNLEILNGTWRFGLLGCRAYLLFGNAQLNANHSMDVFPLFDSLNKFSAPVIVLLISRTCYSIICLDKGRQRQKHGLRLAAFQVLLALAIVLCLLWPLLVYSQASNSIHSLPAKNCLLRCPRLWCAEHPVKNCMRPFHV